MTIQEKALAVAETFKEKGGLEFGFDMGNGSVTINGIPFDMSEQIAYVEMYKKDPTFSQILNAINLKKDDSKKVVPFPETTPQAEVDKDATIEELRMEIDRLNGIISHGVDSSENSIREEDLHIDDFYFAELHPLADEITDEEIQVIIDELKGVEVPFGSFVLHRTGNVAILKIHDDEGITYMVAEDYLFTNVK